MTSTDAAETPPAVDEGPILDGGRTLWTWRGHGYAIDTQPDVDWQGRPWTVSAATIRKEWGVWRGDEKPATKTLPTRRRAA